MKRNTKLWLGLYIIWFVIYHICIETTFIAGLILNISVSFACAMLAEAIFPDNKK